MKIKLISSIVLSSEMNFFCWVGAMEIEFLLLSLFFFLFLHFLAFAPGEDFSLHQKPSAPHFSHGEKRTFMTSQFNYQIKDFMAGVKHLMAQRKWRAHFPFQVFEIQRISIVKHEMLNGRCWFQRTKCGLKMIWRFLVNDICCFVINQAVTSLTSGVARFNPTRPNIWAHTK